MRGKSIGLITCGILASSAMAEPETPARGTALRGALLDTVRVSAEHDLGAPVEFVVRTLLADGDRAFAMLSAQRPGGGAIDIAQTPMVLRDKVPLDFIDGPEVVAFMYRTNGVWTIDQYATGSTDAWWAGGPACENYATLLPRGVCP